MTEIMSRQRVKQCGREQRVRRGMCCRRRNRNGSGGLSRLMSVRGVRTVGTGRSSTRRTVMTHVDGVVGDHATGVILFGSQRRPRFALKHGSSSFFIGGRQFSAHRPAVPVDGSGHIVGTHSGRCSTRRCIAGAGGRGEHVIPHRVIWVFGAMFLNLNVRA